MTVAGHLYQSGMLYKLTSGEDIKPLLKKGARVNQILMDGLNSTPLHVAVDCNHTQAVKNLIAYGADLNASSKGGYTPLMKAMKNGQFEIVELLVSNGAYLNSKDDVNRTALWWASFYSKSELIPYLIQKGAHVNIKDTQEGLTPLMVATKYANPMTVKAILTSKVDLDVISSYGYTALVYAIMDEDKKRGARNVKSLIQAGADIHQAHLGVLNTFSPRPLVHAVIQENIEALKYLIGAGAKGEQEALLYAQKHKNKEIITLLSQGIAIHKGVAQIDLKTLKEEPIFIMDGQSYLSQSIKNSKHIRQKM